MRLESATELLYGKLTKLQDGVDKLQELAQRQEDHGQTGTGQHSEGHIDSASAPAQVDAEHITESSSEFLQIPAQRTTADAVLRWEVFEDRYPPSALVGIHFTREGGIGQDSLSVDETFTVRNGVLAPNEEQIPGLIESFLRNVHTKNPVLDAEQLVRQARIIASDGLGWGAWSCLVLLAAALGRIAKPFDGAVAMPNSPGADDRSGFVWSTDPANTAEELEEAESYFVEIEFRVELPLPQSELASYHHPQMFPSPRSPAHSDGQDAPPGRSVGVLCEDSTPSLLREPSVSSTHSRDYVNPRERVARLCNEEESWYYYLTEIALRRIGNRIINTFFRKDPSAWLDVKPLLRIALEFDTQVSAWSANLPTAMKQWETNYAIRRPEPAVLFDQGGNHVLQELSWALENRLLEVRSWLYQPFMYWLIHSRTAYAVPSSAGPRDEAQGSQRRDGFILGAAEAGMGAEDATTLHHFIISGIQCNLKILNMRSLRHRHHGLWYDMRSTMCAALILLAVVKSGNEAWIPGGAGVLLGASAYNIREEHPVAGKLGHVMAAYDFWAKESPDLKSHRDLLKEVADTVRGACHFHPVN
ncbi:hypothetical protein B0A55_02115 [Friedmanniomyces simplex]|uniref:Transcription factor domain-containing protein n=1 Tax=Friedmanniomyces simplex TaxID=329884 RepID=A0A4U0XSU0_9PEZI|nr:hypothetical protein B0A55_02115 [Friedmanniomyces simplex]